MTTNALPLTCPTWCTADHNEELRRRRETAERQCRWLDENPVAAAEIFGSPEVTSAAVQEGTTVTRHRKPGDPVQFETYRVHRGVVGKLVVDAYEGRTPVPARMSVWVESVQDVDGSSVDEPGVDQPRRSAVVDRELHSPAGPRTGSPAGRGGAGARGMTSSAHPAWCTQGCDVDPADGCTYHRSPALDLLEPGGPTVQACALQDAGAALDSVTYQLESGLDRELTADDLLTVAAGLQDFVARVKA